MVSICFYFQVHQPFRLRKYPVFDIGNKNDYFDDHKNEQVLRKVLDKCYLRTNKLILDLINKSDGKFKVSYSMSGVVLEQFENHCPEIIDSFRQLVDTGCVELLNETYHHSLSYLYSKEEFTKQVSLHSQKLKKLFNYKPTVFRNTELIYNNELANFVEGLGFKGILAEGADHILGWRSPNYLYTPKGAKKIKLLLKNYKLSDDIAFRFGEKSWSEFPLTADKFTRWVSNINGSGQVVNLFMDYETFGEHQWEDKGIFEFLKHLPQEILKHPHNDFVTPSESISRYDSVGELDVHNLMSWADTERDLSAWLGNSMQQEAIKLLYSFENDINKTNDPKLIDDWRKLQVSDNFYYMCTKWFSDGDVHKYFNPFDKPHDSYIAFMNVLHDLKIRMEDNLKMMEVKT
ncbi:MAG: glycoside hydrolase family 57 protein [Nanoarchaeota archaeon]